jgi:hypothetical protein
MIKLSNSLQAVFSTFTSRRFRFSIGWARAKKWREKGKS